MSEMKPGVNLSWVMACLTALGVVVAVLAWLFPLLGESDRDSNSSSTYKPSEEPSKMSGEATSKSATPSSPGSEKPSTTTTRPPRNEWYSARGQILGDGYDLRTGDAVVVDGQKYGDAITLPTYAFFEEFTLEFAVARQCSKIRTTLAMNDFTSRDVGVVLTIGTEKKMLKEWSIDFGDKPIPIELAIPSASRVVVTSRYVELIDAYEIDDPRPGPVLIKPEFYCKNAPPKPQATTE
jgi:hypothetical protein